MPKKRDKRKHIETPTQEEIEERKQEIRKQNERNRINLEPEPWTVPEVSIKGITEHPNNRISDE